MSRKRKAITKKASRSRRKKASRRSPLAKRAATRKATASKAKASTSSKPARGRTAPGPRSRRRPAAVEKEEGQRRDAAGGEPAREREEPEILIPGAAKDDLAEELGEEFVESATSGQQAAEDIRDEVVPEESGGPFIETGPRTEFAYGTDASNPADAEPAAFPTPQRSK